MKNNDLVVIHLDRPRFLKFGHKAIKMMQALSGDKNLFATNEEDLDFETIEKIMYCGLLTDAKANGETLKLEDMEDLLDQAESFTEIVSKMNEAMEISFGGMEEDLKNVQKATKKTKAK